MSARWAAARALLAVFALATVQCTADPADRAATEGPRRDAAAPTPRATAPAAAAGEATLPDTAGPAGASSDWTVGLLERAATAGGPQVLTALRAGLHDDYERVTLELGPEGSGLPGYAVSYVDRPLHECGSGREVHPVGDAWLEIRMEPLDAHSEGRATIPHTPQDLAGLVNLKRVYVTCDFEAVTTLVLAVASPQPFRVLTLDAPRRIVVDVRR